MEEVDYAAIAKRYDDVIEKYDNLLIKIRELEGRIERMEWEKQGTTFPAGFRGDF